MPSPALTTTQVSSDALNTLKLAVLKKHGKLRGALRDEIEAALRAHASHLVSASS